MISKVNRQGKTAIRQRRREAIVTTRCGPAMRPPIAQSAFLVLSLLLGITEVGILILGGGQAAIAQALSAPVPTTSPLPGTRNLEQLLQQINTGQGQGQPRPTAPVTVAPPVAPPAATPTLGEIYRLGPGDVVKIEIFDLTDYSGEYQILVDGSLTLPRIGRVMLAGLTLEEAGQLLTARFSETFVQPITTVALAKARPLRLAVSGEVTRPGSYNLNIAEGALYPSVTDLLKEAGGITQYADLRNIRIRRSQGMGQSQTLNVNLWDLLLTGNLEQDITLRDGDSLIIPKTTVAPDEIAALVAANISPDTIKIGVIGEVKKPGVLEVPPNTSLNQALLAAGGFDPRRAKRGSVRLLRLNPDGTATDRRIDVDFESGINDRTNPILRPNDVVLVSRSGLASFGDTMESLLGPLARMIGTTLSLSNFIFQVFGGY